MTSYDNDRRDEILSPITSTAAATAGVDGVDAIEYDHMNNNSSSRDSATATTSAVVFTSIPPLSNGKSSRVVKSHHLQDTIGPLIRVD